MTPCELFLQSPHDDFDSQFEPADDDDDVRLTQDMIDDAEANVAMDDFLASDEV